jgi:hypothetical protein
MISTIEYAKLDLVLIFRPYVYNVFAGDIDGLHSAVRSAIENPISSFVRSEMTLNAVRQTIRELIALDWQSLMFDYLQDAEDGIWRDG